MSNKITLTKIVLITLIILFIGNVVVSIGTASKGAKLVSLEREIKQVDEENKILTEKLVNNTSLSKVIENVEKLNLVQPTEIVYLSVDEPVAWNHE